MLEPVQLYRDPRFLAPRWSIAKDILFVAWLLTTADYFLARPKKIREQGPTVHWASRDKRKAQEVARGDY